MEKVLWCIKAAISIQWLVVAGFHDILSRQHRRNVQMQFYRNLFQAKIDLFLDTDRGCLSLLH